MNKVRQLLERASDKLELPVDVVAGVPRVELIGSQQCSVEPHRGLVEYTEEQIVIATSIGTVKLCGTELQIRAMNLQKITVSGKLQAVVWDGENHE